MAMMTSMVRSSQLHCARDGMFPACAAVRERCVRPFTDGRPPYSMTRTAGTALVRSLRPAAPPPTRPPAAGAVAADACAGGFRSACARRLPALAGPAHARRAMWTAGADTRRADERARATLRLAPGCTSAQRAHAGVRAGAARGRARHGADQRCRAVPGRAADAGDRSDRARTAPAAGDLRGAGGERGLHLQPHRQSAEPAVVAALEPGFLRVRRSTGPDRRDAAGRV